MIRGVCYLDAHNWRVEVCVMEDCSDASEAIYDLRHIGCRGEDIVKAAGELRRCGLNTGLAFSNSTMRNSIIVIGRSENPEEFVNTLRHEQHHVIMHICEADNIDPYSEDSAYLAGDLGGAIYTSMKQYAMV